MSPVVDCKLFLGSSPKFAVGFNAADFMEGGNRERGQCSLGMVTKIHMNGPVPEVQCT